MKKARELSVLCDVEVALLIFSSRGKLYEFSSANSLARVLQRYGDHLEASINDQATHHSKYADFRVHAELAQLVQSGPELEHLDVADLVKLETRLHNELSRIRSKKMQQLVEYVMILKKKEQILREENELLKKQIAAMKSASQTNDRNVGGSVRISNLLPLASWEERGGI
ncbi:hypothetical protein L6164_015076 [Bauhinia variegata]|uniref:Uncharacterized protein n=1 Tax=Bauhinia variegata TaxID=167791 RepID=A0ACB9NL88_BAUVA|nr:hypothetical protein L6164_015076 [Bauhinia variegata]